MRKLFYRNKKHLNSHPIDEKFSVFDFPGRKMLKFHALSLESKRWTTPTSSFQSSEKHFNLFNYQIHCNQAFCSTYMHEAEPCEDFMTVNLYLLQTQIEKKGQKVSSTSTIFKQFNLSPN